MFKTASPKGAATRANVLQVALALFREKGVDNTTMREIATRASLSLGAAYHYFASKEAIILAYYADVQRQHVELARQSLATTSDLRDRLAVAMHTKLDVLANDRRIMGALLRYTGDPSHPLSFLGATSRPIQLASVAVFDEALADTPCRPTCDESRRRCCGRCTWGFSSISSTTTRQTRRARGASWTAQWNSSSA